VSLKNIGTRRVDLELYHQLPITITELAFTPDGRSLPSRSIEVNFPFFQEGKLIAWDRLSVLPGRTMELNFAASVGQPGTYLISFHGGQRQIFPDDDTCVGTFIQEKRAEKNWFWAATAVHQVPKATEAIGKVSEQNQK
jgi:hypothetical protein